MVFWHFYRKETILNNHVILNCKIISITSNYKSAPSFQCEIFNKNERKIVGSSTNVKKVNIFIGKQFPMAYSEQINKGQILITPENYKEFNIPFPDSLNWVLDYRY